MSTFVGTCPRCKATHTTFDLTAACFSHISYRWQRNYEVFAICRSCRTSAILIFSQKNIDDADEFERNGFPLKSGQSVDDAVKCEGYISIKDLGAKQPPDDLPAEIEAVFREGTACLVTQCWNASGVMFRVCADLATAPLLPPEGDENAPPHKIRRDLGLRLPWLFENGLLPVDLSDLAHCVKEDGNDGAHRGTLGKIDAEDLFDFTYELLERMFTIPAKLKAAAERRVERRRPRN